MTSLINLQYINFGPLCPALGGPTCKTGAKNLCCVHLFGTQKVHPFSSTAGRYPNQAIYTYILTDPT
jgi:hypothetical protein